MTTAIQSAWDEAFARGFAFGVHAEPRTRSAAGSNDPLEVERCGYPERSHGFLAGVRAANEVCERHPLATPADLERLFRQGRKL